MKKSSLSQNLLKKNQFIKKGCFFVAVLIDWNGKTKNGNNQPVIKCFFGGWEKSPLSTICQPYVVTEDTFWITTNIMGVCSQRWKPRLFKVLVKKFGKKIRDTMHVTTSGRLYSLNYQINSVMQKMGVGPSAMEKLHYFMELPNQSTLAKNLEKVELVLGLIQIGLREKSEI